MTTMEMLQAEVAELKRERVLLFDKLEAQHNLAAALARALEDIERLASQPRRLLITEATVRVEVERESVVRGIRMLARNGDLRASANQLLCALRQPCVTEEECR
jgi:hypothetical protein